MAAADAVAAWPLVWDFAGRNDTPLTAVVGADGDARVVSESWVPGETAAHQFLLRIDANGNVAWTRELPNSPKAVSSAPGPGDSTAVLARGGTHLGLSVVDAAGALLWSRSRGGLDPEVVSFGPPASPVWDPPGLAWRVPVGIDGDLGVLSFAADGTPLADRRWSAPNGAGAASAVLGRPGGGLLIAGRVDSQPPGWWIVALDADGTEAWRRFEDGGTSAGAFSGAFLLNADPVLAWADDETSCGLFSLRLWSLHATDGSPRWARTWPATGAPPACDSFTPSSVQLFDDRVFAAGTGDAFGSGPPFPAAVAVFDAIGGAPVWARAHAASTAALDARAQATASGVMLAASAFPPINPGPTPLVVRAWTPEGEPCAAPRQIANARMIAALNDHAGAIYVVGFAHSAASATSANDIVVQRVEAGCTALFNDGFETAARLRR